LHLSKGKEIKKRVARFAGRHVERFAGEVAPGKMEVFGTSPGKGKRYGLVQK